MAAVFLVSALIVVFLAIRAERNADPALEKPAETAAIIPPPDSGAIEPAAITAWQRAASSQNIDIELYNALYVQDSRSYSVLLAPKDPAAAIPTYEVTVERGSNRVLGFNRIP